MFYASNGRVSKAREKKLFINQNITFEELTEGDNLDNSYFGYICFKKLSKVKHPNQRVDIGTYAKVRAMTLLYKPSDKSKYNETVLNNFEKFDSKWKGFIDFYKAKSKNTKVKKDKKTGEMIKYQSYNYSKWYNSEEFEDDLFKYYKK